MQKSKKALCMVAVLFVVLFMGWSLMGCATTKQLAVVEEQAKEALDRANNALQEAENAKALCGDEFRKAEAAALRAGRAADRAEQAADRAKAMADKAEDIFMQKMKK